MNCWYRVTFSAEEVRSGRATELEEAFKRLFVKHGSRSNTGLFRSLELANHDYFFSPGAVAIAQAIIVVYGGSACPPPKRSALAMLVVSGAAEAIAFAAEA